MHKKKSKLRERTQLVFIYTLMTATILGLLIILVLVVQGYRYNRYDGRIEQGGLVQFDSVPDGATVGVDGIQLANQTASKITLTSGTHDITMTRAGYNDWKKTVTVKPGAVLWLNYVRLFPTDPKVSVVAEATSVSSALQSPNLDWMAYVTDATAPTFSLVRLNMDTPAVTTVTLKPDDYTAAKSPKTQKFTLLEWDKDSQKVLVRHDYDKKHEYLVVNLRGNGRAYDVTTRLGVTATKVEFSGIDSNTLYLLTDKHDLRRVSISSTTLSGPIVTDVSDFTSAAQNVVTYATLANKSGVREVGYVSGGKMVGKRIASYKATNATALMATSRVYYGDRFVAIVHGKTLDISTGSLPASDSTSVLTLKSVASLTLTSQPTYLGFAPGGHRFVYAQHGDKITTYDLELNTSAVVTLTGTLKHEVTWIDGYHMAASIKGNASFYDFDGSNGQSVASDTLDLPLAISSDDTYLYYFTDEGTISTLSRVRMLD